MSFILWNAEQVIFKAKNGQFVTWIHVCSQLFNASTFPPPRALQTSFRAPELSCLIHLLFLLPLHAVLQPTSTTAPPFTCCLWLNPCRLCCHCCRVSYGGGGSLLQYRAEPYRQIKLKTANGNLFFFFFTQVFLKVVCFTDGVPC